MKKSAKWMLGLMAAFAMVACSAQNDCKFNVKEYAEGKTERLDEIVDLTDAQEKEVYALYLEQGKQIQKAIKQMKKEGFDHKRPEAAKKADCPKGKPECDSASVCLIFSRPFRSISLPFCVSLARSSRLSSGFLNSSTISSSCILRSITLTVGGRR